MRTFSRPKVVVSKCLEFSSCRYNGQKIPSSFILRLKPYVSYVPVCPEVEIGLGVPRDPIKLIEKNNDLKLYQPSSQKDLTQAMREFSRNYLNDLGEVDGFILKASSPSCGISDTKIFHAQDNPVTKRRGSGLFANAVLEKFERLAIEDEGRLLNFRIREHFLTKLFLIANFRELKRKPTVKALIDFQAKNKLLFMTYHQTHMRKMGRLIAGATSENLETILREYQDLLYASTRTLTRYASNINVLMHALGYFKKDITAREKKHFLRLLEQYREGKLPLSALQSLMQSWSLRYEKSYLLQQTYFEPYPEELIEITDSGKGRDGR